MSELNELDESKMNESVVRRGVRSYLQRVAEVVRLHPRIREGGEARGGGGSGGGRAGLRAPGVGGNRCVDASASGGGALEPVQSTLEQVLPWGQDAERMMTSLLRATRAEAVVRRFSYSMAACRTAGHRSICVGSHGFFRALVRTR